jgi:competence protein ComEA
MNQPKPLFILIAIAAMVALTAGSLSAAEKININTASEKELTQLDRIGPALAERIVKYREKNGPFEKPEDITKVKGIGSGTLKRFSDRITVEETEKEAEEGKTAKSDKIPEKKDSADKAENEKKSSGDENIVEE